MNKVIGYLISRDGRDLFMRDLPEWVSLDENYAATALVKWNDSLEVRLAEITEDRDLYEQICMMLDEENRDLKAKISQLEEK
ncbi:hypothetical protein D3C86_1832440 [compost metagenome]